MEEKSWRSGDEADGNGDGGCMPAANDNGESEWQASNLMCDCYGHELNFGWGTNFCTHLVVSFLR